MPLPPHKHRKHPPITPHPKTVFLPELSVCVTNSLEGTPVALQNHFAELSTIAEIPEISNSPPPSPLPSNASPPHTTSHRSWCSYIYTYVTDPCSPTLLLPSPEHITVTPHVHDHSYASLPHPPTQRDAITKVNNWMNDGVIRIDPVVGMENWEIRIEGLHRKFEGSYPTQLVLFKVQNDLIAKNISDQNFTIDGKQFKIREYLE